MVENIIENMIAKHCAPALTGIKPSNLMAIEKNKTADIKENIIRLNRELNNKDIYIDILCECSKRILLLVYRRKKLEEYLCGNEIKLLLNQYGYKKCNTLESLIKRLKTRLKNSEFPHEIGAFLGYPIDDIYGFINHKNSGCLFVGEWRVYKNVSEAKVLFKRYEVCRAALVKRMMQEKTLAQIFCAA